MTVKSTDRKIREARCAHLADSSIWRTSWTSKRFQGHLYSGSGSPKTLLAAYCWFLAAVPRADDILYTFCQGGGCSPSTSQMKQTWGAGCQHSCRTAWARCKGPTSPPRPAQQATWLQECQVWGEFDLWFLKVTKPLALQTFKSYSKHTTLEWNLNSPGEVKTLLLRN